MFPFYKPQESIICFNDICHNLIITNVLEITKKNKKMLKYTCYRESAIFS